jgi:hypothetical protein
MARFVHDAGNFTETADFWGGGTFEYVGTNSCCQGNLEHRLKSCNDQAGILENVSFILPVGISLSQLNSSGSSSAF